MNVYVRALATHLARAGVDCDVYSANVGTADQQSFRLESGLWLHSLPVQSGEGQAAGPDYLGIPEFADRVIEHMLRSQFVTMPCTRTTGSLESLRIASSMISTFQ